VLSFSIFRRVFSVPSEPKEGMLHLLVLYIKSRIREIPCLNRSLPRGSLSAQGQDSNSWRSQCELPSSCLRVVVPVRASSCHCDPSFAARTDSTNVLSLLTNFPSPSMRTVFTFLSYLHSMLFFFLLYTSMTAFPSDVSHL
jgi:hypothetical protein